MLQIKLMDPPFNKGYVLFTTSIDKSLRLLFLKKYKFQEKKRGSIYFYEYKDK